MTEANGTLPIAVGWGPALDRQVLVDLQEALEDSSGEFLRNLADVYRRQAAALVADMRDAARSGDLGGLSRAAHSLKGSSANVGGTRLAAMCAELERWDGAGPGLDTKISTIQGEVERLQREMVEFLSA
ncbi:MAG TPA: Hpt domain-containing protein [Dermatophilaceae bacterium]|nr:Hpt domain-containing protein [Dermatophilaceae bacterium]